MGGKKPENYLPKPPSGLNISDEDWLELSYDQQYYRASKKHRDSIKESSIRRRKRNAEWVSEIKESESCRVCREDRKATLDFHHVKEKKESVAKLVKTDYSLKTIALEIEKCVILCSNCHRVYHDNPNSTDIESLELGSEKSKEYLGDIG